MPGDDAGQEAVDPGNREFLGASMGWVNTTRRFFFRNVIERWQRILLRNVANQFGLAGVIRNHGATQSIRIQIQGRKTDIGIHSGGYWIRMDLIWPGFPEGADISYAPVGTYPRESARSEGISILPTGDDPFDEAFIVLCESSIASDLATSLRPEVRRTFMSYRDLEPQIASAELFAIEGPMIPRVHLHVELCSGGANARAMHASTVRCLAFAEELEPLLR